MQARAGKDGDLQPGLAALAQSWLDDVALPAFRWPSTASAVSLDSWWDTPQVLLYLKVPPVLPKCLPSFAVHTQYLMVNDAFILLHTHLLTGVVLAYQILCGCCTAVLGDCGGHGQRCGRRSRPD